MNATLPLLGDTRKSDWVAELERRGWGRMVVFSNPKPYPGEPWGFDNGAYKLYADHARGHNGGAWKPMDREAWLGVFSEADYLNRLNRACVVAEETQTPPYLAVVPDIVMGGEASLRYSLNWLPDLPGDWPWYLAIQDGMKAQSVIDALPSFAGIFLGGSDAFKLQARDWCDLAHRHGKRFHFARAGTPKKAEFAMRIGSDSLDSSFPLWTVARWDEFLGTMDGTGPQLRFLASEEVTL